MGKEDYEISQRIVQEALAPVTPALTKEEFNKEEAKHSADPSSNIYSTANLDFDALIERTLMKDYIGGWETWRSKNT